MLSGCLPVAGLSPCSVSTFLEFSLMNKISSSDRAALIRLASSLPAGDDADTLKILGKAP